MLFFSLQVHLQTIDFALILIDLVLHISESLVELSLLTLMSKHKSCLLVFSILSSLLDITLTVVKGLSFLLKLGLEVENLLISVSLDCIKLFLETFSIFSFLFPLLCEVCSSTLLVSDCEFELLIEE